MFALNTKDKAHGAAKKRKADRARGLGVGDVSGWDLIPCPRSEKPSVPLRNPPADTVAVLPQMAVNINHRADATNSLNAISSSSYDELRRELGFVSRGLGETAEEGMPTLLQRPYAISRPKDSETK